MSNNHLATDTLHQIEKAALRPSHAFLISGPPASFRHEAILHLERLLQCEPHNRCGHCPQYGRIDSDNNPNTFSIIPDGTSIKIEQIRELLSRIQYGAPNNERYTVKISDAHQMTTQAANSLLRTLESPPTGVIFLLGAPSHSALLPTIISRCQLIRCAMSDSEKINAFLDTVTLDSIADWSGAPNTAIHLAISSAKTPPSIPTIQELVHLSPAQRISKTHSIGKTKEWVLIALLKWAEEQWKEIKKTPVDSKNEIAFHRMDLLVENILQLRYNLNPRLLLDRFLLSV